MAPILGQPFLEYLLRDLSAAGIRTAILCVGYLKEQIRAYFGDGFSAGLTIRYSEERAPLGTAGALGNARDLIAESPFLLLNGDTYASIDYGRLAAYHREKVVSAGAIGTIVVARVSNDSASGRIHLAEDGRVRTFREKELRDGSPCLANAGVYFFESGIFRFIPETVPASLERDTIPAALDAGRALYGFPAEGDFIDIGTPEGYQKMCDLLAKRKP
jgi:NDP-sugar pyrophosphorylase family protein